MACILSWMGLNMRDNGATISKMELELKLGQMDRYIKAIFKMDRGMVKENFKMLMDSMKVVGRRGRCMDKEHTNGRMEGNIMENGLMGKCMAEVNTVGQMEESMKEAIKLISNKVMEFILGLMGDHIAVNGTKESSMVKVYIRT